MRNFVLFILMIAGAATVKAQNVVYDENAEVRTVEKFNGIEVSGAVSLYLSQGSTTAVAVSAGDAKYNNKIRTEVRGGVLRISVEGGVWNGFNWTDRKLRAYVTVTDLNRLDVSGASYVSISGTLKSDEIKMDVSGASEVKGIVNLNKLNIDVSGASVVKLAGTVDEGTIDASGACKVNSYDLIIDKCKASSSGASSIRVTIKGELTADATGGATIYYKGTGVGKTLNTSGGGSIKSRSGNED
ncbi:head GIN domain-containing protein [Segetibacter koreensis]|uniref:head GIN domain-containing protein n=1 Tax=Segetibacter koreensis TaxID=398037 RepID=UPI00036CDE54|nr:head GIN domain-containing protein [Segetibacter koreensis]